MRIGLGYDLHRLVKGRKLILGGVEIPYELGLQGHSDGDVLLHAVSDAILGAVSKGDIGTYFPDTSSEFKDLNSGIILKKAIELMKKENYEINNIDCVIIAEKPKLIGYYAQIRDSIANLCGIEESDIGLKAKTREGLGGEVPVIEAHVVVLILKNKI